jgi:hypothetical protein
MHPDIPVELMQAAVQLLVYFVTTIGAVAGLLFCGRV